VDADLCSFGNDVDEEGLLAGFDLRRVLGGGWSFVRCGVLQALSIWYRSLGLFMRGEV